MADGMQTPVQYLAAAEQLAEALRKVIARRPDLRGKTYQRIKNSDPLEMIGLPHTSPAQKRWAMMVAKEKRK